MAWLIDPDEQTVFVYSPKQQTEVFDKSEGSFLCRPSRELRLRVGNLFGWLLE